MGSAELQRRVATTPLVREPASARNTLSSAKTRPLIRVSEDMSQDTTLRGRLLVAPNKPFIFLWSEAGFSLRAAVFQVFPHPFRRAATVTRPQNPQICGKPCGREGRGLCSVVFFSYLHTLPTSRCIVQAKQNQALRSKCRISFGAFRPPDDQQHVWRVLHMMAR